VGLPVPRLAPAALLLVLLSATTVGCGRTGSTAFGGYTRSPLPDVSSVSVPVVGGPGGDALTAAPGGLRLVFFGFTSCPDVCPTTLAVLRAALAELDPADRARVGVDVVTVDPERDDAAQLVEYVGRFVPDATAHRTEDTTVLRAALEAFGSDVTVGSGPDGRPEVSHTGDVSVVDDAGRVVLAWPAGTPADSVADDLRRLLAGERPAVDTDLGSDTGRGG